MNVHVHGLASIARQKVQKVTKHHTPQGKAKKRWEDGNGFTLSQDFLSLLRSNRPKNESEEPPRKQDKHFCAAFPFALGAGMAKAFSSCEKEPKARKKKRRKQPKSHEQRAA